VYVASILFILCFSCKKDNAGVSLSNDEKKLLGHWVLRKQTIEEPGQPTVTNNITLPLLCFMKFEDYAPPFTNNSPIFSNTKSVQDHKDCSWLLNAWKIGNDGKLLLASFIDTVYAEILYVSPDSLILRAPSSNNHSILITYELYK